jgi:hypothetical protein
MKRPAEEKEIDRLSVTRKPVMCICVQYNERKRDHDHGHDRNHDRETNWLSTRPSCSVFFFSIITLFLSFSLILSDTFLKVLIILIAANYRCYARFLNYEIDDAKCQSVSRWTRLSNIEIWYYHWQLHAARNYGFRTSEKMYYRFLAGLSRDWRKTKNRFDMLTKH